MAPEQAFSADTVDARADIFSLGVIIFEMLAGRRPVGGEEPHQIAAAYISGQIARLSDLAPDVPTPLAEGVHRAMAPVATDRWSSVTELRDVIQPYAAPPRPPTALPPSPLTSGEMPSPIPAARAEGARPSGGNGFGRDPATNPADPPAMSDAPQRGPTPLGGFSDSMGNAVGVPQPPPGASMGNPAPQNPPGTTPPVTSNPGVHAAGGIIPETRNVMPVSARVDHGATAPLSGLGASYGPAVASLVPHPTAGRMSVVAPRPATTPKRPSTLSSLPAILLLAAGVSAAVVGGVYVAHSRAKSDDHEDPPTPPPRTTVPADPPPVDTTPPPTAAPQPTLIRQPHPWQPNKPPQTKPSSGPVAPPSSSAPEPLFPLIIPSSLPIPLPFVPSPRRDDPPRDQPGPRDKPAPGSPRRESPRGEREGSPARYYLRPSASPQSSPGWYRDRRRAPPRRPPPESGTP
jgi:serine/threonine-protein kinase